MSWIERAPSPPPSRRDSVDARVDGLGLGSIQEINALPRKMAEALYLLLVPDDLLQRFAIDPGPLRGRDGGRLVRITAPEDKPWVRVEGRQAAGGPDPALRLAVGGASP